MKRFIKQIPLVVISISLMAVGLNMFLAPHEIAAGGVSGIGILVEAAFNIDRAIIVLILNSFLLVFALIFLGKEVFFKTVLGSLLLPLALAVVPEIMVTSDKFLSVIFGSALFGIAVSILYRIEASSGGTTIPPLIFRKYFGLNTSLGLLLTDAVIVLFSYYVFGIESFLYAIISIIITSFIMNYIETGLKKRKAMLILSEQHEQINMDITKLERKSLKIFPMPGGYAHHEENILMVVLESKDYQAVMKIVDRYDKKALVVVYNVSDVHGLGITYQPLV